MNCKHCGQSFKIGMTKCPNCRADIHYWGKTKIIAGVEQSSLSITDIFNGTFKEHIAGAGDRMFIAGTPLTTPKAEQMLQEWEQPWLYARVLLVGFIFLMLAHFMYSSLGHLGGYFIMSIVGSLLVPLSIVIFYWEINIPRDIPIYKIFLVFFIGGVLSLIFTIMFVRLVPLLTGAAYMAPFSEEPAKIIAVALFIYRMDCKYIFSGLLLGAAVGAGFAAFEDIWYVVTDGMEQVAAVAVTLITEGIAKNGIDFLIALNASTKAFFMGQEQGKLFSDFYGVLLTNMTAGEDTFFMRAVHSIGTHTTWAAIEGGALMLVKGKEKLQTKHFFDPKFLGYLAIALGLHFMWNFTAEYGIKIAKLHQYVGDVSHLILMGIAVLVVFTLINKGIAQILLEVNSVPFISRKADNLKLVAIAGALKDSVFELNIPLIIGRNPSTCNVIFPPDTPGVSRCHCKIEKRNDGVYIMDVGSSKGTFMNGQRLTVNQWYKITDSFYLGSPAVMFSVK